MLNEDAIEHLRSQLVIRFTPEELIDILKFTVEEIFDAFRDQILEVDWRDYL